MQNNNVPISGFTEGELRVASFWVRYEGLLRNALYGLFIAINVLAWGYVLWTVLDTYAISYPRESRITEEIARNQIALSALEADRPARIQTESVSVFTITDSRLDFSVDAHNQNDQWWAEFTYHFNVGGEQTPRRAGFIMPNENTVITELGFTPESTGARVAELVVEDVRWHRIDPSIVGQKYSDYQFERYNVAFENVIFDRSVTVGTKQIGRTIFDLVNKGAYGYWNMDLVIKLSRGDTLLAVNKITLSEIVPGENRHIEMEWFETLPPITKTEIIPIINFIDQSTYLPTERF